MVSADHPTSSNDPIIYSLLNCTHRSWEQFDGKMQAFCPTTIDPFFVVAGWHFSHPSSLYQTKTPLIIAKILTDILSNEEQRLFPPHQNIAPAYFIMLPPHQNSKPSLFFTSHHPSLLSLSPQSMTMFHQ